MQWRSDHPTPPNAASIKRARENFTTERSHFDGVETLEDFAHMFHKKTAERAVKWFMERLS